MEISLNNSKLGDFFNPFISLSLKQIKNTTDSAWCVLYLDLHNDPQITTHKNYDWTTDMEIVLDTSISK